MLKIAGNNQAGNVICFNNMTVIIMTSAMTEMYNDNVVYIYRMVTGCLLSATIKVINPLLQSTHLLNNTLTPFPSLQ